MLYWNCYGQPRVKGGNARCRFELHECFLVSDQNDISNTAGSVAKYVAWCNGSGIGLAMEMWQVRLWTDC